MARRQPETRCGLNHQRRKILITLAWYTLAAIILGSLAAGGQTTSIVEFFKHYNLTDLEIDKIEAIKSKAKADIDAIRARL